MQLLPVILKILKKLFTIIIYQVNLMSQLHLDFIENVHLGAKNSFGAKFEKTPGRIFFLKMYCQKSPFLLHQMLSIFSTINLVYVLEINIFGRDGIIRIWIISSKDVNIKYLCKIYCRELGKYLLQFDALEKKCNETTNYSI